MKKICSTLIVIWIFPITNSNSRVTSFYVKKIFRIDTALIWIFPILRNPRNALLVSNLVILILKKIQYKYKFEKTNFEERESKDYVQKNCLSFFFFFELQGMTRERHSMLLAVRVHFKGKREKENFEHALKSRFLGFT